MPTASLRSLPTKTLIYCPLHDLALTETRRKQFRSLLLHGRCSAGFGCCLCGRWSWWQRRGISNRVGREEVGRRLLSTFASHDMIMAPGVRG